MRTPRNSSRRLLRTLAAAGLLAVLVASPSFGRAVPTNNYRPDLPPDALTTGCYPLPGGVQLDVPHQVRSDTDVLTSHGPRRELLGQYDLLDRDTAAQRILAAFRRGGFSPSGPADPSGAVRLVDRHGTYVVVAVSALPGTDEHTFVRGDFLLDLPRAALASHHPACAKPSSTKRWAS